MNKTLKSYNRSSKNKFNFRKSGLNMNCYTYETCSYFFNETLYVILRGLCTAEATKNLVFLIVLCSVLVRSGFSVVVAC